MSMRFAILGLLAEQPLQRRIGRRQDADLTEAVGFFVLVKNLAEMVIEFPRAHFLLEFGPEHDSPQPPVRLHQDVLVVEEDIVYPCDAFVPQVGVIDYVAAPVHRQIEGKVQIVIHVRTRGAEPVHKAMILSLIHISEPTRPY